MTNAVLRDELQPLEDCSQLARVWSGTDPRRHTALVEAQHEVDAPSAMPIRAADSQDVQSRPEVESRDLLVHRKDASYPKWKVGRQEQLQLQIRRPVRGAQ